MSLDTEVGSLVVATNELTQEVVDKLGVIDTSVANKIIEIDNYWLAKETEIDDNWDAKEAEINARLSGFDNQEFYVAPIPLGTGDGTSSANATTLQDVLDNKIIASMVNIVHIVAGEHILTSGTKVENVFYLKLVVDGVYDFGSPPLIITPHTTNTDISISETGSPSPSQTCDAHNWDEFPLHLIDSTLVIENVHFRGTRKCILGERSRIISLSQSDLIFNVWVHSLSCTIHSGSALELYDCHVIADNEDMIFNIYHPDYTTCGDDIIGWVSPLVCDQNTKFLQRGNVVWNGTNIPINEYPGLEVPEFRAAVPSSIPSAIQSLSSHVHISKLTINGIRQLYYAKDGYFRVDYLETVDGSTPLQWLGQAHRNSEVLFTNDAGAWPDSEDASPAIAATAIKLENINADPNLASCLSYDGAKLYFRGGNLTTTGCACGTLIATDKRSDFIANNLTVKSPNRAGNQGFMQIINSGESHTELEDCDFTTRQGDDDTAIVTGRAGLTTVTNLTTTASTVHTESAYGRYLDDAGIVSGGVTFTQDTQILVPSEYPTVQAALSFLETKTWDRKNNLEILLGAGNFVQTEPIEPNHFLPISIVGEMLDRTVSNLGTVTGSAGNWSVELNLNDPSNVVIGNYILLFSTTGTGLHQAHQGFWEITNVVGNVITVTNTNQNVAFPASTITSGIVKVMKTKLDFSTSDADGIIVTDNQVINLSKLAVVSYATNSRNGILITKNSTANLNYLGVTNGGKNGILAKDGGSIHNDYVAACNNFDGILITTSSSYLNLSETITSGNINSGFACRRGASAGNRYGISVGNNTGFESLEASLDVPFSFAANNVTTDYYAYYNAISRIANYQYPSSTFSPAVGVEGNFGSYHRL